MVHLDRTDQAFIQRGQRGERAEAAVVEISAGAPGDLRKLGGFQRAGFAPIELGEVGKGDVPDVHVQAHTDGIGGHHVVDLAGLVERDLLVARARRERA